MRKRRGRRLTDSQWMTAAGAVLVAVFLTAMAVGWEEINFLLVALLIVVLVAVGVVLISYRQADPPVPGQGTVVWVSAPPTRSIIGTCDLELDVSLGGSVPVRVRVRDHHTPVHKWPRPGTVLPLAASVRRPDKPKIFWDKVAPSSSPEAPATPPGEPPSGPPTAYIPPVFTAFRSDAGAPPRDEVYYGGNYYGTEPGVESTDHLVPPAPGAEADPDPVGSTPAGSPWHTPPAPRTGSEPVGSPDPENAPPPDASLTGPPDAGITAPPDARVTAPLDAGVTGPEAGETAPPEAGVRPEGRPHTPPVDPLDEPTPRSPWMAAPGASVRGTARVAEPVNGLDRPTNPQPATSPAGADDPDLPRFADDPGDPYAMPSDTVGPFTDNESMWGPPPTPRPPVAPEPGPDTFDSHADDATSLIDEPLPRRVPPQRDEGRFPASEVIVGEVLAQRAAVGQTVHGVGTKLYVADIERARRFYRDVMGFTEVAAAGGRAEFRFPGGRVLLSRVAENPVPARNLRRLLLDVTDIARVYHDLEREGVACRSRPHRSGGDGRSEIWVATLEDPDGNIIELNEPIAFGTRKS